MTAGVGTAVESTLPATRVLMVAHRFPPHTGGVESHVYELARRVAAEPGFQVEVLTTDLDGTLPPREVVDGVRVSRVAAWPRGTDLYVAPEIYRRVRRSRADIVHCQGYHTFVPPLAMSAARRARIPYLVTLHSGGHSSRWRRALRPIQARALRRLLAGARRLIAVSRFEDRLFEESLDLPPDRFAIIPNGADLATEGVSPETARDPDLIVSIGRLERYKGHHRLIEALPLVRARRPGARLLILGSGPYESALRRMAADLGVEPVVEIRTVGRSEVAPTLRRAAVVALLSEYESQGVGIHEALALGCRVLVTDTTALAELGALPQAATVPLDAAAEDVAAALLDQLAAPPVSAAGAPPLPSWDDCARQTLALYRAVLSEVPISSSGSRRP
jgi:glycosyltransferase involved in cell wall biosynthesis